MKIVCDKHIPFLVKAVQKEWPQVQICPLEPEQINAETVREADVLVIRTRTKINGQLLKGSQVRLVCTATIGFDHIDTAWCDNNGIRWMSCPGCNAQAVCDYVEEALKECTMYNVQCTKDNSPTIGIVGVGHVGSLVAKMARRKGFNVLLYDPLKRLGYSLEHIAQNCDVITFHVPLTKDGSYPTYHMCNAAFLRQCAPATLIINAARGGVVDEQALLDSHQLFVLDTWENEPDINPAVVARAQRASMHIAGYSVQGKRNASQMCLDAIAEEFGLPKINISRYRYYGTSAKKGDSAPGWLSRISDSLKADPTAFEELRKAYQLRGV